MIKYHDLLTHLQETRMKDPLLDNLEFCMVPFTDLYLPEDQVTSFSKQHLIDILVHFHPALVRASSVALIDDVCVLWEGQHTAAACWLMGMDSIPCMVFRCDSLDFKQVPSVEKFDRMQLAQLLESFMADTGATTVEQVIQLLKQQ